MAHRRIMLKEVTAEWLNNSFSPLFFKARLSSPPKNSNRCMCRILVCVEDAEVCFWICLFLDFVSFIMKL